MKTNFRDLVREMRAAQKAYYKLVTSKEAPLRRAEISDLLKKAMGLEAAVDRWLEADRENMRQTYFDWSSKKTDEESGAYNVTDEGEKAKESGA